MRSKKSVGEDGAGAEWIAGTSYCEGICNDSGWLWPRRSASGEEDAEEDDCENCTDTSCTGATSDEGEDSIWEIPLCAPGECES